MKLFLDSSVALAASQSATGASRQVFAAAAVSIGHRVTLKQDAGTGSKDGDGLRGMDRHNGNEQRDDK